MHAHLRRLAARLLCCGFLPEQRDAFDELLDLGLGGAVLFERNADTAEEVRSLCADLHARGDDLYIAVDQEGGRVQRFRDGFTTLAPMRQTSTPAKAREAGDVLGRELEAAGIDVNFAPVADVDSNPANPVIGDRSFGPDPANVGVCAAALVTAMQARGVSACMKHFPGHGDTSQDSHVDLPRLRHDLARLEQIELPPFADCIAAGVAACMSAHVIFEPFDDKPATMSPATLGLLRTKLGFAGVIFSDCLEMDAIREHYSYREAVRHGLAAGLDVFLVCHTPERQRAVLDELVAAVVDGVVPRSRLEDSAGRLSALRRQRTPQP